MKNVLLISLAIAAIIKAFGQQYIAPELVSPIIIQNIAISPQKPAGFRLANVDFLTGYPKYASSAIIADENGDIVWRCTNPLNLSGRAGSIFNFNRINDSTMVWYTFANGPGYYLVLNNDYSVRDTVNSIGSIDRMRPHDLLILPNGNYLSMANRLEPISPSLHGTIVKPGVVLDSSSSTIENIFIQETDSDGNLIKEWRSLNHVNPVATWDTSKINSDIGILLLHTNSMDFYINQGQLKLIISNRNSNDIMIIDWNTGNIEERIAGRNKTINFIPAIYSNDKLNLYAQHYCKVISHDETNKKLTIKVFNNRYDASKAEALVLQVDLNTRTVRKSMSFISNPAILSTHLGNLDKYGSTNWFVNWGRTYDGRENATGYNSLGVKQFNLFLPDSVDSYRILPVNENEMNDLKSMRPVITKNGCTLSTDNDVYWQDGSYSNTYTISDTGNYFAEASYGIGWLRSEKMNISTLENECGTVGINLSANETLLTVYPNPTAGIIFISDLSKGEVFTITDITGNEVLQKIADNSQVKIDLSEFAKGIYFLNTRSGISTKIIYR